MNEKWKKNFAKETGSGSVGANSTAGEKRKEGFPKVSKKKNERGQGSAKDGARPQNTGMKRRMIRG